MWKKLYAGMKWLLSSDKKKKETIAWFNRIFLESPVLKKGLFIPDMTLLWLFFHLCPWWMNFFQYVHYLYFVLRSTDAWTTRKRQNLHIRNNFIVAGLQHSHSQAVHERRKRDAPSNHSNLMG